MASTACWRCLGRTNAGNGFKGLPFGLHNFSSSPTVSFSTSAHLSLPMPAKKKTGTGQGTPKKGEKKAFALKKKRKDAQDVSSRKPPAVGERKALRKRIVLSNMNALEVTDMSSLETNLGDDAIGQMISLPNDLIDQLNAIGAFKHNQSWGMFKRPSILIREETLELAKAIQNIYMDSKDAKTLRQVIVGSKSSGKSVYLLQAVAIASLNNWTTIHIPDARDLTIAGTDYAPIPGQKPTKYSQKRYTSDLLQRIALANPHLKDLQMKQKHSLPIPIQENMALDRFANLGADPEISHQIFEALWSELTAPGRPPVLLSMDNFGRANEVSEYRDAAFKKIHAHDFYLISWFISYMSGKSSLPNGGMVVAAMSLSNSNRNPALDLRLQQLEAHQQIEAGTFVPPKDLTLPFLEATGQKPSLIPAADLFFKYDTRVLETLGGEEAALKGERGTSSIEIKRVNGVSKDEARSLMEYWAKSGIVKSKVTEQLVSQKWTLSGGGVLGELEKGCFGVRV